MRQRSGALAFLLLSSLIARQHSCNAQTVATAAAAGDPLTQARDLLKQDAPARAELLVRQYIAINANAAEPHFLLGYILYREIQTNAAATHRSLNLPAAPQVILVREKNARDSLEQYTLGSQLQTPSAFDLKIVSLDYILLKDYPDARKWLTKALAWQPDDVQGWYYLGRIAFKQADYSAAIEAFQHALTLSPEDIAAKDNLGLAYTAVGQRDAAREAFQAAIAESLSQHSTNESPWVDMGDLLTQNSQAAEAIGFLQQAISMDPTDLRAHEKLAEAFRRLQNWPQEQRELEKAIQLAPDSASLHFMLGQAYRKNGDPDKASTQFAASAALHKHEPTGVEDSDP